MDVGGESGRTDTEAVPVEEEIARVVPLVERLAARGALVSVDTWRGPVARAALEAGAAMINDVSGLSDESIAERVRGHRRRARDHAHARGAEDEGVPRLRRRGGRRARASSRSACGRRARSASRAEQIVLDPGIDLAKTPAQSVELLRRLPELAQLGRPLLLAVSRKDFVGALTGRPPADRDAGTLAAVGAAVRGGARIIRVHDVAGARDYLRVHDALANGADSALELAAELKREAV